MKSMTFIVQHISNATEDPNGDDSGAKLDVRDLTSILNTVHEVAARESERHCARVEARLAFDTQPQDGPCGSVAIIAEFHHVEDL
jgi:hypothetical protein